MNKILIATVIFVFLAIFIETVFLILQIWDNRITKWFGKKSFTVHATVTILFWIIAFAFIALLQLEKHPIFHNSVLLKYSGIVLSAVGLITTLWGFRLIGLKRALCLNFYEDNVPVVTASLYKYIKNPIDMGFWTALIGFALFTKSTYNLIIALEFILIMIPHAKIENIPLDFTEGNEDT